MSTLTPTVKLPRLDATGRLAFNRILLSEWTKLRSVRSTKWSLGVGFVLTIAFPVIPCLRHPLALGLDVSRRIAPAATCLDIALAGVNVAQLAIAVLGVLLISGWSTRTGSICSTFTAVLRKRSCPCSGRSSSITRWSRSCSRGARRAREFLRYDPGDPQEHPAAPDLLHAGQASPAR